MARTPIMLIGDSLAESYGASTLRWKRSTTDNTISYIANAGKLSYEDDSLCLSLGYQQVPYYENGWAKRMRLRGYEIVNRGFGGSKAEDWRNTYIPAKRHLLDFSSLAAPYTIIMLGGNDMGGGRSLSATTTDYVNIITTVLAAGSVPILTNYPPLDDRSPALPNCHTLVDPFNTWVRQYAAANGHHLIDFRQYMDLNKPSSYSGYTWGSAGALLEQYQGGGCNGSDYADGAHLSDSGYLKMARYAQHRLQQILS